MQTYDKNEKSHIISDFRHHVSTAKADVFEEYGMEFIMGRREGCYIWDIDGKKKLFNCHSNGGVFNLGHRHPEIIKTLLKATESLDIGNHHFISVQRAKLAKKLASMMPGDLNYTVFGVSGGEAIDLALKVAQGHTKRNEVISTIGGYHGHTGLALATGDAQYREPFGLDTSHVKRVQFNEIQAFKDALSPHTAAVIMETVQSTAGIIIPEKTYMQEVRNLCTENRTLLIIDEVQAGLGRTGKNWAFEHFDIIPDMVVLGKGLSGGLYPMSATVIREPFMKIFNENPFIHISTFGGSEIGSEVTLNVLDISSDPNFLNHVNEMAALFSHGFETLQKKHPDLIHSFNQLGLMMGIKFTHNDLGPLFTKAAYESGIWSIYANNDKSICQLMPPLIITKLQVEEVLETMDKAIGKLKYYQVALKAKKAFKSIFS
jgi:putrescine aminotransferase